MWPPASELAAGATMTNDKIRFGPFELDPRAGELRRGARRVRLQDKSLRMLVALVENPGEIVTREELRRRLWPPNVIVDFDNGLNNAINKLRTVLADSATEPKYIETVGRRGYRFIGSLGEAPVESRADVPARERPIELSPRPPPTRHFDRRLAAIFAGVAILATLVAAVVFERGNSRDTALPFEKLSSDPEQEYFSDGMTDALISQLAGIRSLRVISRQSVMRYKASAVPMPDIARELGVSGVIEGTVLKSADRVRVSVQLIHAPSDRHLWAAEYSRPLDDVIALQSEIAQAVVREVVATVTTEETARLAETHSVDADAYDLYLRGRFFWGKRTEEALHRALDYFERAIVLQPDFALAHAAIAETYGPLGGSGFTDPVDAARKMRAAAERALEIDPELVEGLTALGACAAFHEWQWAEGERHFRRALEINPNYALTHMWWGLWLERQGRQADNLRARERAVALDPLGGAAVAGYGNALFMNGRVDDAISVLQKALEIDPDNPQLLANLALIHMSLGRYDEAIDGFERAGELGHVGYTYGVAGRADEASAVLAELERLARQRYVPPFAFALVHVGLGDTAAALEALERGYEQRDTTMAGIKVAIELAPLRDEPRFAALLEKMGLR
jgi:TolB-like protein/DNA-binding winged helix-turn-helix (wHTH) protein/tetratricopeptide (TPR) repeat protein